MYQAERDMIENAWQSGENDLDRAVTLADTKMRMDTELVVAEKEASSAESQAIGGWVRDIISLI
jgi:hypothetical protein